MLSLPDVGGPGVAQPRAWGAFSVLRTGTGEALSGRRSIWLPAISDPSGSLDELLAKCSV